MNHKRVCRWFEICPLKRFYDKGILDERWIDNYCKGNYMNCVRYAMEEEGISHQDNMMPDGTIDERLG